MKKYFFIINPISGGAGILPRYKKAIEKAAEHEKINWQMAVMNAPGYGYKLAKALAGCLDTTIVVVGGDGTINEIAPALLNTNAVLGIVPKGSGNGLARELALPIGDPEAACQLLFRSKVLEMDAGKANDRYFFNIAGVGLDAKVSEAFCRHPVRGQLPYIYLTAMKILRYKPHTLTISVKGQTFQRQAILVAAAIGTQYGNRAKIAPGAKINDGLFHVTLLPKTPLWKILCYLPKVFSGKLDTCPGVETFVTPSLSLESPQPLPCQVDGEPLCEVKSFTVSILPKALKILVPPSYRV